MRFCSLAILSVLLLASSCSPVAESPDKQLNPAALAKPAWLDEEPIIIVGGWDDMFLFRRRVGSMHTWHEEEYKKAHTEERVLKLKELGVTMAVLHFYKGFGLEAEQEALSQVQAWLESPSLVLLAEGPGYWIEFQRLIARALISGPQVHDARVAALCIHNEVRELWTADRDFSRYSGLRVRNPTLNDVSQ